MDDIVLVDPNETTPAEFERLTGVRHHYRKNCFTVNDSLKQLEAFLTVMENAGYKFKYVLPYTFQAKTSYAYAFSKHR